MYRDPLTGPIVIFVNAKSVMWEIHCECLLNNGTTDANIRYVNVFREKILNIYIMTNIHS